MILKDYARSLPFSIYCYICSERKGYEPECEKMNATYTHGEKKEIFLAKFPEEELNFLIKNSNWKELNDKKGCRG